MSAYMGNWKTFRKIVAISGIIQGFTWTVLAGICIGLYFEDSPEAIRDFRSSTINKDTRFIDLLSFCFYDSLLYQYNDHEDRLLKPRNFNIIIWLYFFLSILWLGVTIAECKGLYGKRRLKYETHIVMLSGIILLVTCILDLVLMSLSFYEYFKLEVFDYDSVIATSSTTSTTTTTVTPTTTTTTTTNDSPIVYSSIVRTGSEDEFDSNIDAVLKNKLGRKLVFGILMTMSTRGFIIWFFNCLSGVILTVTSIKAFQAPPILKYDNRSIPRARMDKSDSKQRSQSFGSTFAEDNDFYSTPPQKHPIPPPDIGRYGNDQISSAPLALNNNNRAHSNMFY